jgi:hypothetical protein
VAVGGCDLNSRLEDKERFSVPTGSYETEIRRAEPRLLTRKIIVASRQRTFGRSTRNKDQKSPQGIIIFKSSSPSPANNKHHESDKK